MDTMRYAFNITIFDTMQCIVPPLFYGQTFSTTGLSHGNHEKWYILALANMCVSCQKYELLCVYLTMPLPTASCSGDNTLQSSLATCFMCAGSCNDDFVKNYCEIYWGVSRERIFGN